MRILITGAAGFAGRHLARELAGNGHNVVAFDLNFPCPLPEADAHFTGNLQDIDSVIRVVIESRPDACIHLGAVASVVAGKEDPDRLFSVNVQGTVHLLEAFRKHAPQTRVLVISTAHVYGTGGEEPMAESHPMAPSSLYAVSKTAADLMALTYARQFNMPVLVARPSNHTGPGQTSAFVVASFVHQVQRIARGQAEPVIRVGNLDSERDFADVRDVVTAYRLLIERGRPGEAYNISTPTRRTIREILDILCRAAHIDPKIQVDPQRFRPTDRSPLLDTAKIERDTGWKPRMDMTQTLEDMLKEEV